MLGSERPPYDLIANYFGKQVFMRLRDMEDPKWVSSYRIGG